MHILTDLLYLDVYIWFCHLIWSKIWYGLVYKKKDSYWSIVSKEYGNTRKYKAVVKIDTICNKIWNTGKIGQPHRLNPLGYHTPKERQLVAEC